MTESNPPVDAITSPENDPLSTIDDQSDLSTMVQLTGSRWQSITTEFPVGNWDRYEFVQFLGEGGMGQVYKARDPRLNRFVALKFIRGEDAEMIRRFVQEARAQARIEHDNICKVYEVGEVRGHPFIAMQFIAGPSLKEARQQLSLEQKVLIMQQAAQALHAAHRLGIIHRDIKPANIMLEKGEDGEWRPFIMDFGLARNAGEKGQTVTGAIMGTPAYMPPEQAKGELQRLDRRADIYSLGASLHELLAGQPPFQGEHAFELMLKVVRNEPPPLRSIDRTIPIDLETIVLKCLEKEPQRRYDSARALADDLRNYLEGEPVSARRAGLLYRLSKRAAKYKALVTVSAAALVLIMIFALFGIHARITAARQAAAAQQFGEQVKEIESISQYAKMLSLHDIRPQQRLVAARIDEIKASMQRLGEASNGPGNFAIARGYLSLGQIDEARQYLERAWRDGYRNADTACLYGEILCIIYNQEHKELINIQDRSVREARLQEIDNLYLKPAQQYLRMATGAKIRPPIYIEAMVAFLQEDYQQALAKADQAYQQTPWLFEAKDLVMESYFRQGQKLRNAGQNDEALRAFQQAELASDQAIKIAPSNAELYNRRADLLLELINFRVAQGLDDQIFLQARTICDQAILADPDNGYSYAVKALVLVRQGERQAQQGETPTAYDDAERVAERAIMLSANNGLGYSSLGQANMRRAEYQGLHGIDPIPSFDRAIDTFQRALLIKPNNSGLSFCLGLAYWLKALYCFRVGIDVRPLLDNALKQYQSLSYQSSHPYSTILNTGNIYELRAEYEANHGIDPEPWLAQATEIYQQAISIDPNHGYSYNNLGIVNKSRGKYQAMAGLDPRSAFSQSIDYLRKGVALTPTANGYLWLGESYLRYGQYQLSQQLDPQENARQALAALDQGLQINGKDFENYLRRAQVEIMLVDWARQHNGDTAVHLTLAEQHLKRALELNNRSAELYLTNAQLALLRAPAATNPISQQLLTEAVRQLDQALAINAALTEAMVLSARIKLQQIERESDTQQRLTLARAAQQSLQSAQAINPLLNQSCQPLLKQLDQLVADR